MLKAGAGEATRRNEMTKKVLCAVDDTEHAKSAVALATELAKATGAELTLLVVNVPMGARGRVGIEIYACEDADLKRVLDSATYH
jgi:nucleotide-binding universal stress UspA family protein